MKNLNDYDVCNKCGEFVKHIDAGFSPALHGMAHDCGGTWIKGAEDKTTTWRERKEKLKERALNNWDKLVLEHRKLFLLDSLSRRDITELEDLLDGYEGGNEK